MFSSRFRFKNVLSLDSKTEEKVTENKPLFSSLEDNMMYLPMQRAKKVDNSLTQFRDSLLPKLINREVTE
jgi:hypothetical protein